MMHAKLKETSNESDWACPVQFLDRQGGGLVDLTGSSFKIALTARASGGWNDYGSSSRHAPVLQGSSATGEITIAAPGTLMIFFPVERMRSLCAGAYRVGMTVTNAGRTVQLVLGYLPIRDGAMQ